MIVTSSLYNRESSKFLTCSSDENYIPLAQLLSWINVFKLLNTSITFFKTKSINLSSPHISESEFLSSFKRGVQNEEYLKYTDIPIYDYWQSRPILQVLQANMLVSKFSRTRSHEEYISGWGLFGIPTVLDQIDCVFCTVVHKDNCLGVINCILENKEIDNSILEVWYNSKLRIRGSEYLKHIKSKINAHIKELEAKGIKSVGMNKIPFFKSINIPSFKNISEKKEFISLVYKKMLTLPNE